MDSPGYIRGEDFVIEFPPTQLDILLVCINKYLTGLPHAMNRRELMEEQQQQLQEQQNSSSSSSSVDGCTVVEMDLEEDLLETTKLLPRPSSPTTITGSPSSSSPTASTPSTSSSKPRTPDYFCTRCKDAYTVRHTPIHPLFILSTDAFLVFAMVLMTICMAVLTTCCSLLIFQHWSSGQILFDFGGYIRISMNSFAVTMLLFCHSVNAVTWSMVISHCSGRTEKWVVGIDDDEEEEVLDEQETASTSL